MIVNLCRYFLCQSVILVPERELDPALVHHFILVLFSSKGYLSFLCQSVEKLMKLMLNNEELETLMATREIRITIRGYQHGIKTE